ncbi:MAG TPA: hypothetical protein VHU80_15695 [Polyangiaceae bacterium]|nr:hypothetical protein [Polyangiaceae bacterium]
MIQISVFNESTAITDAQIKSMISAFSTQWNRDLAPQWGLEEAKFAFTDKNKHQPKGSWWVVFLDDSDEADALAYHDVTDEGLPISKVFVKTLLQDKASVSVGATHEICEMAVDPTINLAAQDQKGVFWAYEVCDPVEADEYGYDIEDVLVTDFVTPAWFGYENSSGPMDFKKHAKTAFEVLSGGYAQRFDSKRGWVQVNGESANLAQQHVAKAATGSRRERRTRTDRVEQWKASATAEERNQRRAQLRGNG